MSFPPLRPSAPPQPIAHAKPGQLRRLGLVVATAASAFAMSSPGTGAEPRPFIQQMCEAPATTWSGENASCWPR
jgi:hypothetical protein